MCDEIEIDDLFDGEEENEEYQRKLNKNILYNKFQPLITDQFKHIDFNKINLIMTVIDYKYMNLEKKTSFIPDIEYLKETLHSLINECISALIETEENISYYISSGGWFIESHIDEEENPQLFVKFCPIIHESYYDEVVV